MKKEFQTPIDPESNQAAKKNLVWVTVFSITMMFAGFTSAYFVSMGGNFWVKVSLPMAFYYSTAAIVLSSLTLWLAHRAAKRNELGQVKAFVGITLFLGLTFAYFQFRGYANLVDRGAMLNTWIIVNDGRYGDYFEVKVDGQFMDIVNNRYALDGVPLEGEELAELKTFFSKLVHAKFDSDITDIDYGKKYRIFYKGEPLAYLQNKLQRPSGDFLGPLEMDRLNFLARNIVDDRADFFIKGELGKDFNIYYQRKPLEYKGRQLYYNNQPLSTNLNNKLLRGNKDTSTAYMYILTVLHLLHVIAGIIMLTILFRKSFSGRIMQNNALALQSGGIFWHFLGGLWIFLLLFLVFIH